MPPPPRDRKRLPRPGGVAHLHILRLGKAVRAQGLGLAELALLAHGPLGVESSALPDPD